MNKHRKEIIFSNQISVLKTLTLGGYEQKVLIEGKNKTDPIVICLHGGPGMPVPFSAGCRGLFPEFTDNFIMVYWDQLGCGINNRPIDNNFKIDMFVDMTVDLINYIKGEYPTNKIIILGTSWGSILALKAVTRYPKLVDAVLSCGQVIKELFFNQEVFQSLENSNLSATEKQKVVNIKSHNTHSLDDLKGITSLIRKYTEGYQAKSDKKTPMGKIISGLITSPDYSFKDFIAIVKNGYLKNNSLYEELIALDLTLELQSVQVNYRILQGATDIVTSTKMVTKFVSDCNKPNLSSMIIDKCGHIPNAYGMDILMNEMLELKKKIV